MGVFVATASGKNGENIGDVCPASSNHAFAVGAIGLDGRRSPLSGFGPNNALLAPGERILSLRSKDSLGEEKVEDPIQRLYVRRSGASTSASKAAGVVSLLLAEKNDLTSESIEDILLGTADDMGVKGWDGQNGAGALNATQALGSVNNMNLLTVKLDRFQINRDEDGILESVDVYATVRGEFRHFTVGIGEVENPRKIKPVAGPFKIEAEHAWVARIGKEDLADRKEWVVYIEVKENSGRVKSAQALLDLR
jgi:hypothetical protein